MTPQIYVLAGGRRASICTEEGGCAQTSIGLAADGFRSTHHHILIYGQVGIISVAESLDTRIKRCNISRLVFQI